MEQVDGGFHWLSKAFHDRCFDLICLGADPRWEALRVNARFRKLVVPLGLP
jgi:hypothetical protein